MPLEPTKDGYSFIGWFTNENLTEEFILSKMPANNIILFAKWTALPVITLNLYDDKKILIYQEPGTEITVEEPTRTGYEFTGWDPVLPSTMPSKDEMHTAQWKVK